MKCPNCEAENPETKKFCRKCGSKLLLACPKCGAEILPDDYFCGDCGHDLKGPKELLSIDYSAPQTYTPKHLAEKILVTRSAMEGEKKLVTVFFADVADFTSMSEKLDPEEIHQIMDGAFKILMDEIHRYEGTVNQFTGDGVMALFGAPVAHEDHAQRACRAALSVQKSIAAYGEKIKKDAGVDFKIRIGMNSGPVIVGSIGDDLRMDYTAVGDTTNLAARMESSATPGSILISDYTYRMAKQYFEFENLGQIDVKGKEKPQKAYKLIKPSDVETRIEASISKGLTRFVGRKKSMPALMEVWDKARACSGQVVGVVGEAGVGKSRMLLEFRNRLPQNEFTYLEGHCLQYGENMIYLPILELIKSYFDIKEDDREFIIRKKVVEKIFEVGEEFSESALPVFQDILSLKVDDEAFSKLEPKQKREKTFETIRDLFIRESRSKPLILAIEDLHWIDKTSEALLDYQIEWLANTSILLILLYRTEYRHQWGSKTYYNRIGLTQLGTESSAELVQAMLEDGEIAPEIRELILNRAAGNPLFMEELTHTLLENGAIEKQDKQYILRGNISNMLVPDTIQGIITARMDRLEDNLKRTMQIASVIGRDFTFRILQTITGMREELKSYLLNLQGLEFIYEKSLFPELEYIFKHALTQEVAYNSLLLKRRKKIHEKIGTAIEELYPKRLEELYEMLAYHYSRSDNVNKACRYLKLSGEKAEKNYSHSEALEFFKQAADIRSRLPESKENKRLLIEFYCLMVSPMRFLNYPDGSLQILQQGERLSKEVGDKRMLAHFYSTIGMYCVYTGDYPTALKHGENCLYEAEKAQDVELIAPAALNLFNVYTIIGQSLKIVDIAPKVLSMIESANKESEYFATAIIPYPILCASYGFNLGYQGNFEKGEIFCEKGLRIATEVGDLATLGVLEWPYGFFYFVRGDGKRTIEHCQKSVTFLEKVKYNYILGQALATLGGGYHLLGDLKTAQQHIEKGYRINRDTGVERGRSLFYLCLGFVFCDSGDFKNAKKYAEKALELTKKKNERHYEARSRILLGRVIGKANVSQANEAEGFIMDGIRILEELKLRTWLSEGRLFLGELYADVNWKEKALKNLKTAKNNFIEMGMDYWLARTYASYADLYKKEGKIPQAKENLNKAIKILTACGADGWVKIYQKEMDQM
ncbi:adenylate/guanylate cyclase domain-containing protein [Thermodesulfobacteriota bacterium]